MAASEAACEHGASARRLRPAPIAGGFARHPARDAAMMAAVLLAVAVLTRSLRLGDPAITTDEQFYLLVGDRIWQGALPFVDIWDRKPVGLFLLYALFRPLSQDGIVAYQLAAMAFAAGTAFLLSRIALRVTGAVGATLAGALYLICLPLVGGAGGQSPVFYDLFTAAAALLAVRCINEPAASLWRNGLAAMLLTGLALQVKYMALFEGVVFGLTFVWLHWRRRREFLPALGFAIALVAAALSPTVLAFATYAFEGHGGAFVSSNFVSIFQKHAPPGFSAARAFLGPSALRMAPIMLLSSLALLRALLTRRLSPTLVFALAWSVAAFVEFFAIGNYFDHYAIPLLLPLVIIVASGFEWTPFAFAVPCLAVLLMLLTSGVLSEAHISNDKASISALTHALEPYARQGCIYVYDGPTILYVTTHTCLPTRYVFPSHLSDADEADATDAHASLIALLARRPSAIVSADKVRDMPRNRDTEAVLARALASDYHLVEILPDVHDRNLLIYARNDLH